MLVVVVVAVAVVKGPLKNAVNLRADHENADVEDSPKH
jgi:hypothetical protein